MPDEPAPDLLLGSGRKHEEASPVITAKWFHAVVIDANPRCERSSLATMPASRSMHRTSSPNLTGVDPHAKPTCPDPLSLMLIRNGLFQWQGVICDLAGTNVTSPLAPDQ